MTNLLLVLSKDPYTTEIPNLVLDIGLNAKARGNNVSLYLVEAAKDKGIMSTSSTTWMVR